MVEPSNGATVMVWPLHSRVPVSESAGPVFLPVVGKSVPWNRWWSLRFRDGDIALTNPSPPRPAAVVRSSSTSES